MPSVSRRYPTGRSPFERPSGAADDELRAPVVLMVSGGADSTALLVMAATSSLDIDDGRGCARIARERLHVLHVNHQLRGLDAEEDEEFVRDLAAEYGIPCTVERIDVAAAAAATGDNVENAGREARYAAAARIANELSEQFGTPRSAARICTAHTANDRAETFFMNAIRGSGAAGLSSIPRRRNRIVRPLLDRTHDELCELLRMRGIVWREDDTNRDTRYLRAFVRHEVLPVVERRNPRVMESLAATCDILSDEDAYLSAAGLAPDRDLTRGGRGHGRARCRPPCRERGGPRPPRGAQALLMVEAEARLEARHINRVLELVAAGAGSVTLPMGVDVRVEHGLLFLRAREAPTPAAAPAGSRCPDVSSSRRPRCSRRASSRSPTGRRLEPSPAPMPASGQALGAARCRRLRRRRHAGGRLWVDTPQPGDVVCPSACTGSRRSSPTCSTRPSVPAADRERVPIVRTDAAGASCGLAEFASTSVPSARRIPSCC